MKISNLKSQGHNLTNKNYKNRIETFLDIRGVKRSLPWTSIHAISTNPQCHLVNSTTNSKYKYTTHKSHAISSCHIYIIIPLFPCCFALAVESLEKLIAFSFPGNSFHCYRGLDSNSSFASVFEFSFTESEDRSVRESSKWRLRSCPWLFLQRPVAFSAFNRILFRYSFSISVENLRFWFSFPVWFSRKVIAKVKGGEVRVETFMVKVLTFVLI